MAYVTREAPGSRRIPFVKFWTAFRTWLAQKTHKSAPMPRTERMARDAGISAQDFAKMTHDWPSEQHIHPRW